MPSRSTPLPLPHPGPRPAVPEFAAYVSKLDQHPLQRLVYSPILQRYYEPDDALADRLAEHFVTPVRFAAAVRHLQAAGVNMFVEAGGRAALSKLVIRLTKGSDVRALPSLAVDGDGGLALDSTLRILREAGLAGTAGAPGLVELLAPTVPADVFEAYWTQHGDEVLRRIADDLGAFTQESATDDGPTVRTSPAGTEPAAPPPPQPRSLRAGTCRRRSGPRGDPGRAADPVRRGAGVPGGGLRGRSAAGGRTGRRLGQAGRAARPRLQSLRPADA
ncbi:hypothetical protein NKH18_14450 [Streptomyces sp. M10(2022)]